MAATQSNSNLAIFLQLFSEVEESTRLCRLLAQAEQSWVQILREMRGNAVTDANSQSHLSSE